MAEASSTLPSVANADYAVQIELIGRAVGQPCQAASECVSEFCVDGVCCDGLCGDGADDCQVCAAALGASADGTCSVLGVGAPCGNPSCTEGRESAATCDGAAPLCPLRSIATACPTFAARMPASTAGRVYGLRDRLPLCRRRVHREYGRRGDFGHRNYGYRTFGCPGFGCRGARRWGFGYRRHGSRRARLRTRLHVRMRMRQRRSSRRRRYGRILPPDLGWVGTHRASKTTAGSRVNRGPVVHRTCLVRNNGITSRNHTSVCFVLSGQRSGWRTRTCLYRSASRKTAEQIPQPRD